MRSSIVRHAFRLVVPAFALALVMPIVSAPASATDSQETTTSTTSAQTDRPAFYDPPDQLNGKPGDVIRAEPMTWYLDPFKQVEMPGTATRIMYQSTDTHGNPMAVTGVLLVPDDEYTGPGNTRPIIGYAPGTQGLADRCAPSRQAAMGTEYESAFVAALVSAGYAVVMTDYENLGTPGVHTYMTRASQGHAVLDAVRAAQQLESAGLSNDGPVGIAGYSQGGGAAAAAAELAQSYASGLDIKGVVAGAVPADLGRVAQHLDGSLYFLFLGYAVSGLSTAYDVDVSKYLNEKGERLFEEAKDTCVFAVFDYAFTESSSLTESGKPITSFLDEEPFKSILADNLIGTVPPDMPVLVVHSIADDVIPYDIGRDMAASWCDKGAEVYFHSSLIPTHVGGALPNFIAELAFFDLRFGGWPFIDNCWTL